MYLSLLATSLSLLSFARAGQHPLYFNFEENVCSIAEQSLFSGPSVQNIEEEHHHGSGSCSHHEPQQSEVPVSRPSPWTHKKQCLEDEENYQEYCVYTNAKFANERGISFFTTRSIAKQVESLPAFSERGLYDNVNKFDNPPWEVRRIPGRGNGLFATRKLNRGDEIIAATPVGVYHRDAFIADKLIDYQYLRKTFDQMPNATREIILRTAANNPGDPIMERINTNAFLGEFEDAPHFLFYPETALMNHDCRPNSMHYHDPSTLIHATYASRTILPGEEITITYINILQTFMERQTHLWHAWGFQCTCALCSSNPGDISTSDSRTREILAMQTYLADWTPNSQGTPKMARQLLSLYEAEEVHAAMGKGHMLAALAYNAVGDTYQAKKHANLAIKAGIVSSGEEEADTKDMAALNENPEGHWSFKARTPKQ
ncbi:SET domain-containing protein [Hyaloscypha variabilis F]|uniref:SET domain-containing protein n=1 Tax=Hyaloscypha variabilis (strain UAMH 11265 / GT02V1 / F) TaxID=1149755 RepID=A0A2J6S3P1_HYAVF|nr:SET domain-containing protein [Hyaloscypha variabilis F]